MNSFFFSVNGAGAVEVPAAESDAVVALYLGETFSFVSPRALSCETMRAPLDSEAAFDPESPNPAGFTPDKPGLYRLRATSTMGKRDCYLAVFPAEGATDPRVAEPYRQVLPERTIPDPNPRSAETVRGMLRRYCLEQSRNGGELTALDSLTKSDPVPSDVDWRQYVVSDGRHW